MLKAEQQLIDSARERAKIRRRIRNEQDRIADQLDALCDLVIYKDAELRRHEPKEPDK